MAAALCSNFLPHFYKKLFTVLPHIILHQKLRKIKNIYSILFCVIIAGIITSCSYPKNFTQNFYQHNESRLLSLKDQFRQLYDDKPFSLLFEDKNFSEISLEIITDTIKYIYHFNYKDAALQDTLHKYRFNTPKMMSFIQDLKNIQCTWVTNLDYYEDKQKKYLVLMAVRNKALNSTFKGESYCLLTFFNSPQPFDAKGRFLDKSERKHNRRINGSVLHRVNNQVGYSIARHYR